MDLLVFESKMMNDCCVFQRLLVCNPSGRLSAEDGLQHGYFSDLSPSIKFPSDSFWTQSCIDVVIHCSSLLWHPESQSCEFVEVNRDSAPLIWQSSLEGKGQLNFSLHSLIWLASLTNPVTSQIIFNIPELGPVKDQNLTIMVHIC